MKNIQHFTTFFVILLNEILTYRNYCNWFIVSSIL